MGVCVYGCICEVASAQWYFQKAKGGGEMEVAEKIEMLSASWKTFLGVQCALAPVQRISESAEWERERERERERGRGKLYHLYEEEEEMENNSQTEM